LFLGLETLLEDAKLWLLKISAGCCVFRGKLDTDSTANRSLIPRQTGHPVQRKLDSNSASNWTV